MAITESPSLKNAKLSLMDNSLTKKYTCNLEGTIFKIKINKNSKLPIWLQLKNDLTTILQTMNIPPNTRLPSLRKIGRELSISYLTVAKATESLVDENIIASVAGSGYYTINLKYNKVRAIGVLVGNAQAYMFASLLEGIQDRVTPLGINFFIHIGFDLDDSQKFILRNLRENKMDGLIVYSDFLHQNKLFINSIIPRIPIIVLNRCQELLADGLVYSDDEHGMALIVDALCERSHKNVVFLSGDTNHSIVQYRRSSFEKYAKKKGINYTIIDNVLGEKDGYLNAMHLIFKKKKNSAVVCWSDNVATGVLSFFNEQGIKVPEEIAVVGYGNLNFSEKLHPKLTSVEQHFSEMGKEAVDILLRATKKRTYKNPVRVVTKTDLSLKESL